MSGFLKVKVAGLKDLDAELARVREDLRHQEEPAAMAAGEPIRDHWQGFVPVDEGNYRDSLTVAWTGKGAAVGTRWLPELPREQQPFLYAKPLEFGNSHQPAQPSARPALAASKREALAAGETEYRTVIKGRRPRKRKPTQ